MRTKLFISHATPKDNEFAAWLATKLELHGYDVWVDIKKLNPAVDFWNTIESTIRNDTAKFLFVATTTSILGNRDGVKKELAVADRVRNNGLEDFIIPLRADDVPFDSFPVEVLRQNAIDFCNDWAIGLIKLLDYLKEQNVSKTATAAEQMTQALERWKNVSASDSANVVFQKDYYYSNLFPIILPHNLYAYNNKSIIPFLKNNHMPRKILEDCVITFVCPNCVKNFLEYEVDSYILDVRTMLNADTSIKFFDIEIKNPRLVCVNLINWTICNMFYHNGMRLYKPTDKTESKKRYFFKRDVKSKRHKDSRDKALSGKYNDQNWHYAQSAYFTSFPFSGILFRAHLLFTDSNNNTISDTHQQSARRSKGKLFFNNEWRNMLQAAMYLHSGGRDEINVDLCCLQNRLIIMSKPYVFTSEKGYIEPSLDPLINTDGGFDDEDA